MDSYIVIEGKKIELSSETLNNIKDQFKSEGKIKETSSENVSIPYKHMFEIQWDKKEAILIKDNSNKRIYVNQNFANNSDFGENCVFIKCEFGSYCEFGLSCKFGSCCKFGSYCKK